MPDGRVPLTVAERLSLLEREVATLRTQLDAIQHWRGGWPAQLGGSAQHLSQEDWDEFQQCCKEAHEELNRTGDPTG